MAVTIVATLLKYVRRLTIRILSSLNSITRGAFQKYVYHIGRRAASRLIDESVLGPDANGKRAYGESTRVSERQG